MKRTWLGLLAAVATTLAAVGPGQAQIKLGLGGPITGGSAVFGSQMKNGAEQAVEDINAAGGILGQKVQLFLGDDVSRPEQGVSVANKFAGDGVKFVVGHFNSGVSIPASDVYQENGILQITPASTNPVLTERKLTNVFRTCGRDDQQGAVGGKYIAQNFKGKKVAVIHDKTPYGKGLADEIKKNMNSAGVTEVLYEGVNVGEKDFSALVSKLRQQGIDLVVWGGLYPEGGLLVRQMRDQGVNAVLLGGDGIASAEFGAVGGPGVEGTLMTYGPDPTKRPNAAAIVKKLIDKKINPESYTLYTYAAVQILQQAMEATKTTDPKKVAEYMHSGKPFDTVIGTISYDAKGDRTDSDYVMYIWKKAADGKLIFEEMQSAP
ncbi:MAG: branched chain amino acid ABC transporter substrate-binding protein [Rhizobiales bacterium 62-17]|jgi:branched-chain amino acid transport system substrate-binding protein|nr:branched-chain amino acid ABC transporter substrate-binding protein [Hyphomicrobiales bacterium]OJY03419.1 MAG: branched chain amino acid ABC transporter substrate-binding protein [Rhizobiales bacterium 62-17]HEV2573653.1 branched-chain amino acid ABC transporter substrate-binding protein [Beijerinckiaceae bacterium]